MLKLTMAMKTAGSVFLAVFLVLLPVAVPLTSASCVTYKNQKTCGLEGSSVEFTCSFPNNTQIISISGWFRKLHPSIKPRPLKQMPGYVHRITHLHHENNDCTMELKNLKSSDQSIYYFVYTYRNAKNDTVTCEGVPGVGVRLQIFASPVKVMVKELTNVPVAGWTVMEGQAITLDCVPTCAVNLNSNPGYIWYRNKLQLNGSRDNSRLLSLDPISIEDSGNYVCAMIGSKGLPSSAFNLTVKRRPTTMVGSDKPDGVPTQTKDCVAQNSTHQINYQTPKGKSMFTFSITLAVSVCIGWVIAITVGVLVLRMKKKKKKKSRRTVSVPEPSSPNSDSYMALDIRSAEYDTLDNMRSCSAPEPVYENL